MKNLLVPVMLTLLIAACSPTRNEMRASRRADKNAAYAKAETPANNVYYASSKKMIALTNEDSLQRKHDLSQVEMLRKIDKDKAESFDKLKKSMTTKVYTTTLAVDIKKSVVTVEEDTLYSVKGGGWYAVE